MKYYILFCIIWGRCLVSLSRYEYGIALPIGLTVVIFFSPSTWNTVAAKDVYWIKNGDSGKGDQSEVKLIWESLAWLKDGASCGLIEGERHLRERMANMHWFYQILDFLMIASAFC